MGFNPFIQVFYFYIAQWRECCAICSSFNPFIQVFYFYTDKANAQVIKGVCNVLIPLFRSFIFTGLSK